MTPELDLAARLHRTWQGREETVATAESLTGGALADLLSAVPGASTAYVGGVVSYATSVKERLLGVPGSLIAEHGVVSEACATAMATGVRDLLAATWAVATTGVAGPTEQEGKPVGTVFVAVAGPDGVVATALRLTGDRTQIRRQTCEHALRLLGQRVGT